MSDMPKTTYTVNQVLDLYATGEGLPKLHAAAAKGEIQMVRAMVHAGADINEFELSLNIAPLFCAIAARNLRMVEELICLGANVNIKAMDQITALFLAIIRGNLEIVKHLLDNGADFNARIEDSDSALHSAAMYNHVKIGELLIERGLDVNIRNGRDETALHNTAKAGTAEFMKMLIAQGADINAGACNSNRMPRSEDPFGSNVTPIFLAVAFNFPDVVDVLIKAGADVNATTSSKLTALHPAAQQGSVKLVSMLLAAGSDVNVQTQSGRSPLYLAVENNHTEVVKALLQMEDINVNPVTGFLETPLAYAVGNNNFEVIKLLVAKGAPINDRFTHGATALHAAVLSRDEKLIEFLIDNGAILDVKEAFNHTPLHYMCITDTPLGCIKILLDKGAEIDITTEDGSTPLHFAVREDNIEIVKYLISRGADPNAANCYDVSTLHHAVSQGSLKSVKVLLPMIYDINVMTTSGVTPLHYAVVKDHPEIAEILLSCGADPNAFDLAERTALHLAAAKGRYKIAKMLLKHEAIVDLKEATNGQTPLFLAVRINNTKLAKLLLDEGADPNAKNTSKVLPIHIAANEQNVEIVKTLLTKGAYYNLKLETSELSGIPMDFACRARNTELITVLKLIEELFNSVLKNDINKIRCCIEAKAILNARDNKGMTALHHAVGLSNIRAVNLLIKNGADISYATNNGSLPLHVAITTECIEIVESLLTQAKSLSFSDCNAVINSKIIESGATALHKAAKVNNSHIAKLLLTNGAIYNAKNSANKTPSQLATDEAFKHLLSSVEKLFKAVKKEHGLEEVKQILEKNNSVVNARDVDGGGTPLYWSVSKGHSDIANVLLANGADYCLDTNKGTTPLHIAASKGNLKVVETLVKRVKADNADKANNFIDTTTMNGTAALHVASNVEVVKCLLQAGARYDICNGCGNTSLELSKNDDVRKLLKITQELFEGAKKGTSSIVKMLNGLEIEECKAVLSTRNEQGHTLVNIALTEGHVKIASKLLEKLKKF